MNFEPLFLEQIHPGIALAARFCSDLCRDRELPRRKDFRPAHVRSILGYVFLIDVLPEECDYYFGLVGEHMPVLYGFDLSNKRLSQLADVTVQSILRRTYDGVVASHSYQYLRGRYVWPDRSVDIERLLVPMAGDDGKLSTVLGVTIPDAPADSLPVFAGIGAAELHIHEQIADGRRVL